MIGIKQAQCFCGPLVEIGFIALKGLHAGDINIAQIKRFLAALHPIRQGMARAARRLNTDRVEPGRHPDIIHLGGKAQMVGIIWGKAFWPVKEGVDARLAQHRHAVHCRFENGFEMVEILGQLVKFETVGDACHAPWLGHRFKRAQHHFAGIFLVIGAFVGHPQHRQRAQALDGFGDDIEMLARMQRHVYARHAPHLMAPHAGAIDDHITGDMARISAIIADPVNPGDPPPLPVNGAHACALGDHRAAHACPFGQGQGNIGRVGLAIGGQPHPAGDIGDVQMRVARLDFAWRQLFHGHAKGARHGGVAVQLFQPLGGERGRNRADLTKARGHPCFGLEPGVKLGRVAGQFCHIRRGAQLPDQPRGVPSCARRQLFAFQEHHILPAELGQVIGNRTANNAAANDDHTGMGGKGHDVLSFVKGPGEGARGAAPRAPRSIWAR